MDIILSEVFITGAKNACKDLPALLWEHFDSLITSLLRILLTVGFFLLLKTAFPSKYWYFVLVIGMVYLVKLSFKIKSYLNSDPNPDPNPK